MRKFDDKKALKACLKIVVQMAINYLFYKKGKDIGFLEAMKIIQDSIANSNDGEGTVLTGDDFLSIADMIQIGGKQI